PGQKLYERARARQETDCGVGRGVGRAGAHAGASTISDSLFSRREYRSPFFDRKGTARLSPVRLTTSYERQNLQNDLQPLSARLVVFPTVLKSLSSTQDPRSRFFLGFDGSFRVFQTQMNKRWLI